VADLVGCARFGLSGAGLSFSATCAAVFLIAIGEFDRRRGFEKLQEFARLAFWFVVLTNTLTVLFQLCGRSSRPLVDFQLLAADHWLHLSTAGTVHWVIHHPALGAVPAVCYTLVPGLILLSLLIPVVSGRKEAGRRFLVSLTFGALLTAVVFWIYPALGPWAQGSYLPTAAQSANTAYFALLRAPGPVRIDFINCGIVAFPSFHVVLAVLPVFALWPNRVLRPFV